MMNKRIFILYLVALFVWSGCLDFGDDVELAGDQVDASIIAQVEQITGVHFPKGTKGLNYFFLGSGIDNALWLKVIIPEDKKAELLQNQLFEHKLNQPNHNMTLDRSWWAIKTLDNPSFYSTEINNGTDFLGCAIGIESGKTLLYLHWFST